MTWPTCQWLTWCPSPGEDQRTPSGNWNQQTGPSGYFVGGNIGPGSGRDEATQAAPRTLVKRRRKRSHGHQHWASGVQAGPVTLIWGVRSPENSVRCAVGGIPLSSGLQSVFGFNASVHGVGLKRAPFEHSATIRRACGEGHLFTSRSVYGVGSVRVGLPQEKMEHMVSGMFRSCARTCQRCKGEAATSTA